MKVEVGRKRRSDLKKDIKPTVKIELKDAIYRMSYITQTPVKDVAESMILYASKSVDVIELLSQSFRRFVQINGTLYRGHLDKPRVTKREQGYCEQLTVRLKQQDYETISVLAYALDVSPTRVCAILLNASMRDFRFINTYVNRYLSQHLTDKQIKELQSILRYSNDEANVEMTMASLLSDIVDEVRTPVARIKEAVSEFIIHNWRE